MREDFQTFEKCLPHVKIAVCAIRQVLPKHIYTSCNKQILPKYEMHQFKPMELNILHSYVAPEASMEQCDPGVRHLIYFSFYTSGLHFLHKKRNIEVRVILVSVYVEMVGTTSSFVFSQINIAVL